MDKHESSGALPLGLRVSSPPPRTEPGDRSAVRRPSGTALPRPGFQAGARRVNVRRGPDPRAVYLEVQRSEAFQEVRSRYRRFVVPAAVAFFLWYVAYIVAATAVPGLMARPVVGAVNIAMFAGLGQFLTTFLLTWAYARHARLHRDRSALQLRWDTQELTRGRRK